MIRPGIWVTGEPPAVTGSTNARLTVGGPGVFGYRYRVNDGPWSDEIAIGGRFDPTRATVRTGEIKLDDLTDGDYRVEVVGRDFAGEWQEEPTVSQQWTVQSSEARLLINEVLAKNLVAFEHFGTFPDLIELHNAGGVELDIANYSITDDPSAPRKYVFGNTSLAPGGYLVLHADDRVELPGIHLGFALRQGGEGIYLYDHQGTLVDSVSFGVQVRDFSIGRIGHDQQWQLNVPTPGAANRVQPVGDPSTLRINEWFANGERLVGDDFVELFNPEPLPVNLAGLFLSDEPAGNPQQHQIPELSFVGADGYVAFVADGEVSSGPNHLSFRLSADQEVLALRRSDGTILDQVLYYPQTTDVSQGRTADGGYSFYTLPTPAAQNVLDQRQLETTVISELHYHPRALPDDTLTEDDLEFVEIRNQSARLAEIAGWRLHEAVDYRFVPDTALGPWESLIVVSFDPVSEPAKTSAFRVRYGVSPNVHLVGPYDGQLSNRSATVELSRPVGEGNILPGVPFESVDVVRYRDVLPWPSDADGLGSSLTRADLSMVGGRAENWLAARPTPGDFAESIVGDVNGDRNVDHRDIDALHAAIRAASADEVFDANGDELVDSADVTFVVQTILRTNLGDADLDGNVDFDDFLALSANFGAVDVGWQQGDFDGDRDVDFDDFLQLAASFGRQRK